MDNTKESLKADLTPDGWLVWADWVEENAKDDFDRFRAKTIRAAAKLARVMLFAEPIITVANYINHKPHYMNYRTGKANKLTFGASKSGNHIKYTLHWKWIRANESKSKNTTPSHVMKIAARLVSRINKLKYTDHWDNAKLVEDVDQLFDLIFAIPNKLMMDGGDILPGD